MDKVCTVPRALIVSIFPAYNYYLVVLHAGSEVVRHELCRITTAGTRTYAFLELEPPAASSSPPSQNHLLALAERVCTYSYFIPKCFLCAAFLLAFLMHLVHMASS